MARSNTTMKIGLMTIAYNEERFIKPFLEHIPKWVDTKLTLISAVPWYGEYQLPDNTDLIAQKYSEVIVHNWDSEASQRNAGLEYLSDCDWVIVLDPDEFLDNKNWRKLYQLIKQDPPNDAFVVEYQQVYWKDGWQATPNRDYQQLVLVRPGVRFVDKRVINSSFGVAPIFIHHFSWARTDKECWNKISHYAHANDFDIHDWFENVWKKWTPDSQDVHPTTPEVLHRFIRAKLPPELDKLNLWAKQN